MKKFLLSLSLMLGLVVSANALSITYPLAANTSTNVFTNAVTVSQFVLANATSTPSVVWFFDSPDNTTNIVAAYTNAAYYTVTITNSWTNYFGVVNSNVYSALTLSNLTVARITNLNSAPLAVTVPTNTTIVLDGTYRFLRGLLTTNGAAAVTVSATYQQ